MMENASGLFESEKPVEPPSEPGPLFEATLSTATSRYINSKAQRLNQNESLQKMDLRHMCDNVVSELSGVLNESAFDYLKVQSELKTLHDQVDANDTILGELEDLLLGFKDNLRDIKGEMTSLQERSLRMNVGLNNRRSLQHSIEEFIECVAVDPEMIEIICNKDVADTIFLEHLSGLAEKLEYMKKNMPSSPNAPMNSTSRALKEIEPELQKLRIKASTRITTYLQEQFSLLKRPKTNIQILQRDVLMKHKPLLAFLREHHVDVFVDLCNTYVELVGKIYYEHVRNYQYELNRIVTELYTKHDLLLNENPANVKMAFPAGLMKELNINASGKASIFDLLGRDSILIDMEEKPIIPHVMEQKSAKILPEAHFKSMNKILLDIIASEFVFTLEFFGLKPEHNKAIFGGIFKQTILNIIENLKSMLGGTYDIFGIVLIATLNEQFRKLCNDKGINLLEFFYDQVRQVIWPRFEVIFDLQIVALKAFPPKAFKLLEKQFTTRVLVQRFVDFATGLYRLFPNIPGSTMLKSRMLTMKSAFLDILKRASRDAATPIECIAYIVVHVDYILTSLTSAQSQIAVFEEDLKVYEGEIATDIEKLLELYLKEYFSSLVDFVRNYTKIEQLNELMKGDEDVSGGNTPAAGLGPLVGAYANQSVEPPPPKLIENIILEFNESWARKIEGMKVDVERTFGPTSKSFKQIFRKFLTSIMAYYNAFFKFVKDQAPNLAGQLVPLHSIIKEMKGYLTKLN